MASNRRWTELAISESSAFRRSVYLAPQIGRAARAVRIALGQVGPMETEIPIRATRGGVPAVCNGGFDFAHFHFISILRLSGVSRYIVHPREKPRKTLLHRVVAPTGFEPVFGRGHVFASSLACFSARRFTER